MYGEFNLSIAVSNLMFDCVYTQMLIQELGVDVAFVERLDSDSGNIVTLVKDIFNVSLITVELGCL